jgi:hypothetical protein
MLKGIIVMNEMVKLCDSIAEEAHKDQTRKFGDDKGKPYKIHPECFLSEV